jgi:phosphate transport system substrate-binding protein
VTTLERLLRRPLRRRRSRAVRLLTALVAISATVLALAPMPSAVAAPAAINGSGSTYVALAMQQWVADAQTNGLKVNYLPTGSPQGLNSFGQSLIDFAGTEAEFSSLGATGGEANRGYQYVPDVAGAVAVMYNVSDSAGRKVDYLRLSRRTVARIFTGDISRWNDPAISADNVGLVLPDQPITVVYRGGQSGTTALFYDFVANVAPDIFGPWAAKNQLPTSTRIIQLDSSPNFAPKTEAFTGSDQIAQFVASGAGQWSIAYDEFGYAKTYNATAARVQNAAGQWVLPYAANISAALVGAKLRPDLSQELSGVYNSTDPTAYPISAYSYIVTQCATAADRPTCKGPYSNGGVAETLSKWLRYIACDGQVNMGSIGYSPLPSNLSQEISNSIGRMTGAAPEQLNAGNCANPRFKGQIGGDPAPPDPLANVKSLAPGSAVAAAGSGGGQTAAAATSGDSAVAASAADAAAGGADSLSAVAGKQTRAAAPAVYARLGANASIVAPLALLLGLVLVLPMVWSARRRRRT